MPVECTNPKKRKSKKKNSPTMRIEPGLPDSESNTLPLFQTDMLEKVAIILIDSAI